LPGVAFANQVPGLQYPDVIAVLDVRVIDEGIDWLAWIEAVASLVTLCVVVATAVFAYFALKDAKRTRHAQLATELIRHWTEPEAVKGRALYGAGEYTAQDIADLVAKLFGPPGSAVTADERSDWDMLALWANQVEFIGVLASEKAITPEVIYKMWGGGIQTAWKAWEPAVMRLREYDGEPDTYQYFQEIALKMRKIGRQRERERLAPSASARDPQAGEEAEPRIDEQTQSTADPHSAPEQ
jgi:hypothetical protein